MDDKQQASEALGDLLDSQQEAEIPAPEGEQDIDPIEYVALTVKGLESSIQSLHVAIVSMGSRLDVLEGYISYLLSKDPVMGPKLAEQADKMRKQAEEVLGQAEGAEGEENQ